MKKIALALAVFTLAAGVAAAEIDLGAFPLGSWLDSTYDAVWTFTTGDIQIFNSAGALQYDFKDKTLTGFKVGATADGVSLSFSCDQTGKTYTLTKGLGAGLKLKIVRASLPDYSVDMPKK